MVVTGFSFLFRGPALLGGEEAFADRLFFRLLVSFFNPLCVV